MATLSSDERRRLQREAVAAGRVKHRHCMQCYGCYVAHDRSKFYLLLEFLAVHCLCTQSVPFCCMHVASPLSPPSSGSGLVSVLVQYAAVPAR